MDYSTIERNEVKEKTMNGFHYCTFEEFTDPIGFAEKQIFSPIDADQRSVFSVTSLTSDFPSISMTSSGESLNSESTAASVWTPFSGISDCVSAEFSIGLTIRSDSEEFLSQLAPNKKCSKVEDLNEYYKQFERTRSPGGEELSEDEDADDSFDLVYKQYSSETSANSLTKEETEEHCILESVESDKETKSDTKINTLSDTDSKSQLWGENEWSYDPTHDDLLIPDNYMPAKRQSNKWNEMNAEVNDWSEDSSDSDDSFDFFGFRKSTKGLTKEETEEHSIPESVESEKETKSDTKINTSSDMDSDSNLFAINWTYEPSFDEHWIPENYLPNIPKRQTNNSNEWNAEDIDWYSTYVVDSADLMKSDEVQENRELNEELSEEKSENRVEIEPTLIEKDSMEDQMEPRPPVTDQTVNGGEDVEEVIDQMVNQNVISTKSQQKVLSAESPVD